MSDQQERTKRFAAVQGEYAGYTVRDRDGSKIGKVDDVFIDENDRPEYVSVKVGFFGTRSTLIPLDASTVDEGRGFVEVNKTKQEVKDAPNFDDGEITPEYEQRVRGYYGLSVADGAEARGGDGAYYDGDEGRDGDATSYHGFDGVEQGGDGTSYHGNDGEDRGGYATTYHGAQNGASRASRMGHADEERRDRTREDGTGTHGVDVEGGRFRGHSADDEGANRRDGSDLEDEDELRIQRSEEELRVGVREREVGKLNVKKRARTERERIAVPKRREEVSVERVPVNEPASEGQIGEDEVGVPVVEEEVVVDKRAVVKEELRIKKDVVEEEEVVEADLRKEEVDIDDPTQRLAGSSR